MISLSHSVTLCITFVGKGISTGDKVTLSQAKTRCLPSPAQLKPFAGKVFYLDLPSNRIAETLESDIKDLGGVRQKHVFPMLIFGRKVQFSVISPVSA